MNKICDWKSVLETLTSSSIISLKKEKIFVSQTCDSWQVIYFVQIFISLYIIVQKNDWLTNWSAIINFFYLNL